MLAGIVLSLAASPPVAARLGLDRVPLRQPARRSILAPPSLVLIATSLLSPRQIRRASRSSCFVVSLVLVAATPFFGAEVKGARRWLVIAGVNIQPSEFVKPAFVDPDRLAVRGIDARGRTCRPTRSRSRCCSRSSSLLVLQPDFGQTMLIALVWGALFFMAGMRLIWVAGLAGVAARRPGRRLFHRAARRASASSASSIRRRATPSTSTSRWNPSRAAAGSAAARARAR